VSKRASFSAKDRHRWRELLELAVAQPQKIIKARTYRRAWSTKARPVLLRCEDGQEYVVKGQQAGRQIVNEQIVAKLGLALDAPVAKPQIIEIPAELIELNKDLAHIPVGTAHGSLFIPDCFLEQTLIATSEPANRLRLALLAVLYGWTYANDRQYLFKNNPPRLIYSIDRGHFFPNGADWTAKDLMQAPEAQLDLVLCDACHFAPEEIEIALDALAVIDEAAIIEAVATPPPDWAISMDERIMVVEYLITRQQSLLLKL
jgi:hypothetical protein